MLTTTTPLQIECKGTIDCTAAFLSNVKYSLTFPPFFFYLRGQIYFSLK